MTFRAGDTVRHKNGETWMLACDERAGYVIPAGWPPGEARAADCELVGAASCAERLKMLLDVAGIDQPNRGRDEFGARCSLARDQLMAATLTKGMCDALERANRSAALAAELRDALYAEALASAARTARESIEGRELA